ncbi:cation:proton antiporter domain-containing protein [Halegenticoccus soli]|uniref:cation:proton antiporter domain-containing protein n=1 Tax=Halegenticoccus soli TaxID=1985678 RepID=UPI000C6EAACF|nr:cation:proton antiporter [Halegenticoccus soli]
MQVIQPLGHHELLVLFLQLFLLLFVARGLGELARRANLPSVVGELLAGIVLGPSILAAIAPGLFTALFPQEAAQYHLLEVVSWFGLIMLLILTGLETDLDLIQSRAKSATYISIAGIVVPFALGFGLAYNLPDAFLAGADQRLVFSLFVATALSISAIPVIAKVLMEMDVIRRDIGQITLAAGMINDTIGWVLLAVVAGLARSGAIDLGSLGTTLVSMAAFFGLAFTLGDRAVRRIFRWVDNAIGGVTAKITTLMILALGVGSITHYMHLEAVLGAFVVGILVGQTKRFGQEPQHVFEIVTIGIFAPIFFATAGLRVDLTAMADPTVFLVGMAVLAVAIVGKFVGSYAGAKAAGLGDWEGIAMGAGMNARGAMEIIIATIGLSLNVLTSEMYTIIVMVAIVTSLMAPPLLRWTLPKVAMTDEERDRLEREERQRQSFLGNVTRVLLPTRCSADSQFAAQLVGHFARNREIEVTNMYVPRATEPSPGGRSIVDRLRRVLPGRNGSDAVPDGGSAATTAETAAADRRATTCLGRMREQLALSNDSVRGIVRPIEATTSQTVLSEARNGYDMLVLGVSERAGTPDGPLFNTEVDDVILESPCPLMVVNSDVVATGGTLDKTDLDRILLPTVGTEYNRHAAEVAFAIAQERGALVEVVHVVNRPQLDELFVEEPDMSSARALGEEIVDREADLGRQMGAEVTTRVIVGDDEPEREILRLAEKNDDDLLVLGSNIRTVSQRAFFGHRVEHIIRNSDRPVAVISSL